MSRLSYLIYDPFYNVVCWYYYLSIQRYCKRHLSELFTVTTMMFHKIIQGFRYYLNTFSRIYAQNFRSDFLWFSFFLSCGFNFFYANQWLYVIEWNQKCSIFRVTKMIFLILYSWFFCGKFWIYYYNVVINRYYNCWKKFIIVTSITSS